MTLFTKIQLASGHHLHECLYGIKHDIIKRRTNNTSVMNLFYPFHDINNHLRDAPIFECGVIWP